MKDFLIRFSVSLPKSLLDTLDKNLASRYSSRSEVIRDLIREKIIERKWLDTKTIKTGVLTIVYDHHQSSLTQRLIDVQHKASHSGIDILCTTHVHIDDKHCLETIIIKGTAKKIEQVSLEIAGLKGVQYSNLAKTAIIDD